MANKQEKFRVLLNDSKSRKTILVTVVIITVFVVIALIVMGSKSKPAPLPADVRGVALGAPPQNLERDPNAIETPAQTKMVSRIQSQLADRAEVEGGSAQPIRDIKLNQAVPAAPPAQVAQPAAPRVEQMQADMRNAQQVSQAQTEANIAAYQRGIEAAYKTMERREPKRPSMLTFPDAAKPAVMQVALTSGQPVPFAADTGAKVASRPLIDMGTVEAIQMSIAVNTDVGGPVLATIVTGKYAGAKLAGTVARAAECAKIQFTSMSVPSLGVTVPVSAIAIDENRSPCTASSVDRHLMTKYVLRPTAAAITAIGQAVQRSNTTVTIGLAGVTESRGGLSSDDKKAVILGAGAQQVSTDISSMPIDPTVKVDNNQLLGVMFLADVSVAQK